MAADQLINHLQEKLVQIQDDLFTLGCQECDNVSSNQGPAAITTDSLIRGALEAAFVCFDEQIARERQSINISGGCAAIAALVMLDKLYVAHAGDCRAVVFYGNETFEIASEFTPETDAKRIQYLAHINPDLTHSLFSDNCFIRPLGEKDIGNQVLCRGPQRAGWHYKEVTDEDVYKPPLVAGRGKWARLMGVIGVTRGFGDYGLVVPNTNIHLKPFLSAVPEVRVFNLANKKVMEDDVMVMGCDGLWDMLSNEQAELTVKASFAKSAEDTSVDRYTRAAQDLVLLARGDNTGRGWKMQDGRDASFDDITVFVIPLHRCLDSTLKKKSQLP
uniref:PPM-type phosphatase domain-containing protein n=2 Tax=Arion vulgaris TaxID=1028688 RepID=A0A0B7BBD5_9EUPU